VCMRIEPSVCSPYSSLICGCFVASIKCTGQDTWAFFNSCGMFVNAMRLSRPNSSYRQRETRRLHAERDRGSLSGVLITSTSYKQQ
jgi:hypothetical protein